MPMTLEDARASLTVADHDVLSTLDPDRGVHAVPVCFALVGDHVVVPVDRVKPKSSTALRRIDNLDADPREFFSLEAETEIRKAADAHGFNALGPLHAALDGRYPYETLYLFRAFARRQPR
jgi:hypothetical protein